MLKHGLDRLPPPVPVDRSPPPAPAHEHLRGREYYQDSDLFAADLSASSLEAAAAEADGIEW